MGTVVALGDARELQGFALAGARVVAASGDEVLDAWRRLDDEVGLVILSGDAAERLDGVLAERPDVLTAVVP